MKRKRSLVEVGSQLETSIHVTDPSHIDHSAHIKKARWISQKDVADRRSDGEASSETASFGQQRERSILCGGLRVRQTLLAEGGTERNACVDSSSMGTSRHTSSRTTESHHVSLDRLVREHVSRLADSEALVRVEAVQCIAAHIRHVKYNKSTAEYVHDAFVKQLWKEDDHFVLEKLVFTMSLLAVLDAPCLEDSHSSKCGAQSNEISGQPVMVGGGSNFSKNVSRYTEEIDLNKDRSSDGEIEGIDLNHNAQDFEGVGQTEIIPISVALLQYLSSRRQQMSDTVKLQVLRSLHHIAVNSCWSSSEVIVPSIITMELGSFNPRVRIWAMRLITNITKQTEAFKEHGTADNLIGALEQYMQDSHPGVRETCIRSVMSLYSSGWKLNEGYYQHAVECLEDDYETVRLAAVQLVGMWVKQVISKVESGSQTKNVDGPFVQVCKRLTDMSYRVRQVACQTLGEMECVSEGVLLQTLSKKVLSRDKEAASDPSGTISEGVIELTKGESASIPFDSTAAGAFVHGLDDEYFEVRAAAIEAMAQLSTRNKKLALGAVELLVDMLNDDAANVRMQTMQGLLLLARAGQLAVLEKHLHMFLSVLEDTNAEMRKAAHNLLSTIELPSISSYKATVRAFMAGLEHHPEDSASVIQSLTSLGLRHGSQTECIADGLVDEMRSILNGDEGLDEPRYAAILALFISASRERPMILTFLPSHMLAHSGNYMHKFPKGLSISQDWLFGRTPRQMTWFHPREFSLKPADLHDEDAQARTQEVIFLDKIKPAIGGGSSDLGTASPRPCPVLNTVRLTVQTANGALLLSKSRSTRELLRIIRVCKSDLQSLLSRENDNKDAVKFAMLYIGCTSLAVQIHASLRAKSSTGGSTSLHQLFSRFDTLVKQMQHCFTGQQRRMLLFVQELDLLLLVWKQVSQSSLATADNEIAINKNVRAVIAIADAGFTQEELQESHLFKRVRELVTDNAPYPRAKMRIAARDVALECWPNMVVDCLATVREKHADIRVPKSTCESPLLFTYGMPLAIKMDITLQNVSTSHPDRIWVRFTLENSSPQFTYLDTAGTAIKSVERDDSTYTAQGLDDLYRQISTAVPVMHMPSVEACVAKIEIVLECFRHVVGHTSYETPHRGPRSDSFLIPLSTSAEVHLSRYQAS